MRFIFFHSKYAWEFSNLVFREVYLMRVWAMGNKFSPDICILYSSRFRKTCVFHKAILLLFSLFFHTKTVLRLLVLKPRKCLHFFRGLSYDECEHTLDVFWKSELMTSFFDVIIFFLILGVWSKNLMTSENDVINSDFQNTFRVCSHSSYDNPLKKWRHLRGFNTSNRKNVFVWKNREN